MNLTNSFREFVRSERAGGLLLIACTALSLFLANLPWANDYAEIWRLRLAGLTLHQWINDLLMAVFFLLIGLELKRELYVGELSRWRDASLPLFAAAGGMLAPALIHYGFNAGTATQAGFGIPMGTDIAFALAALSMLGARVPPALKVFVVALAVIDDLGAILLIATVYTGKLSMAWLGTAVVIWFGMWMLSRRRVVRLAPYLVGGAMLWFCVLHSGVHATIAGVALAFALPFARGDADGASPSHRLEHRLQKPVAFLVLPLFAMANTAVPFPASGVDALLGPNGAGIALGLLAGKPLGIFLFSALAVALGISRLPDDVRWTHLASAGILGGIGFTMSIFIANLAFAAQPEYLDSSKLAVLMASLLAGLVGMASLAASTRAPVARHSGGRVAASE
jgi:NhaA family Na+:H+ antiporter